MHGVPQVSSGSRYTAFFGAASVAAACTFFQQAIVHPFFYHLPGRRPELVTSGVPHPWRSGLPTVERPSLGPVDVARRAGATFSNSNCI